MSQQNCWTAVRRLALRAERWALLSPGLPSRNSILDLRGRMPAVDLPTLRFEQATDDTSGPGIHETRAIAISCEALEEVLDATLRVGSDELGPPALRLGENEWHWRWQPRGRAGTFAAVLTVVGRDGRVRTYERQFIVAPGHLDRDDFDELLGAIQASAAALVYTLMGGMRGAAPELQQGGTRSLIEAYWTRLLADTRLAVNVTRRLEHSARDTLRRTPREHQLSEIREPRADTLARTPERPLDETADLPPSSLAALLPPAPTGRPRLPRSLPAQAVKPASDLYEHRLLARVLHDLLRRCMFVREELRHELRWRERTGGSSAADAEHLVRNWDTEIGKVTGTLRRCLASPLLHGLDPAVEWKGATPLMRRDARYRMIWELWRRLDARPFVASHSPAFDLPVADSPSLFELWCLLEVARALEEIGTPVEQRLVQSYVADSAMPGHAWKVSLAEDVALLRHRAADGSEIALYYRRRYQPNRGHGAQLGSLDPFLRIPDIAIEIMRPDECPSVLIFDAKYRRAPGGTIPEEVLGDAYTYAAAIGYAGAPATLGAYLLFPGTEGFQAGGIGAVPLRPGSEALLHDLVRRILERPSD